MLFIVRFTDRPGTLPLRNQCLAAHLDWLAQHRDSIRVAGSIRTEEGSAPVGSCWIVDAPDRDHAHALCAQDPFWVAGLRESVEILYFSPAPGGALG